ncbi:glycosyltransferase family 2 protein [Candidatus Falkowbacteria bacterium]|nr:glycosyltransferase family 2 protein [Candidatus Falkowbacteria bacterium]
MRINIFYYSMFKKVAVILVNYKDYARHFLEECRDSLRAQNYPKESYAVYIIDNDSSKETREYLKETYPEAIIIPRSDGLPAGQTGNYAAANNVGIKRGREDGCELFIIANMDTKFDPAWLSELVKAAKSDARAGIAQSKILLYPKTEEERKRPKINSLGNIIHYLGFGFTSCYGEEEKSPLPFPHPVRDRLFNKGGKNGYPEIKGYASGCSFLIKKEVLDKIGGYNEEFYMYHDDMEISWKTKLAGYKIILAPASVAYHKYDFDRSIQMLYYMERNRYLAIFIFYRLPTLFLILPAAIFMEAGMLFYSLVGGWFKTKIKIYGYFLKRESWKRILKARKESAAIRKVGDNKIADDFSGRVLFQEISNPILKYFANPILDIYWRVAKRFIFW